MNTATVAKRVRRRQLKVGKVFICTTEGGHDHPTHSCPKGDPIVVNTIFSKGTKMSTGVIVTISGQFIHPERGPMHHSFRLCDLRELTAEEWGI
jgi:hypothetical protein